GGSISLHYVYFMNRNRLFFMIKNLEIHKKIFFLLFFVSYLFWRNALKWINFSSDLSYFKVFIKAVKRGLSFEVSTNKVICQMNEEDY
ncbi:hypothetical protein AKJ40_04970, partial [candidate division MSBL1 archaeon SCGC-AAA259M10]